MNNNLLDTLTISSIESNDPKNNLLINTEQHIALKKNREDIGGYMDNKRIWTKVYLEEEVADKICLLGGGDSYDYRNDQGDYQDLQEDLIFLETARMVLDAGDKVIYSSWW